MDSTCLNISEYNILQLSERNSSTIITNTCLMTIRIFSSCSLSLVHCFMNETQFIVVLSIFCSWTSLLGGITASMELEEYFAKHR